MFNGSLGFAAWLRQECLMFHVSERNGFSLAASRRFAVSDTACCSFLTLQRYYISIAVYEYISKIILRGHLVIWSFVKIEN